MNAYCKGPGALLARLGAFILLLAAACAPALADAGRTGAGFMSEGFNPRAKALADAYVGISDDAYAMFYNVSGLSQIRQRHITTTYFKGLADLNTQMVGYGQAVGSTQSMGVSVAHFNAGVIDIYRPVVGKVESRKAQEDWLISLGYSLAGKKSRLGRWHVGAGIKILKSTIAEELRSQTAALDLGALLESPRYSLGISLANLGPGIGYSGGIATGYKDPLPLTLRAGGTMVIPWNQASKNRWLLTTEVRKVFLEKTTFALGTEFLYRNTAAIRLGYRTGQDLGSLSMGMGLKWEGFRLDYSLGLMQDLNYLHTVSITHFFGRSRRYPDEIQEPEKPKSQLSVAEQLAEIAKRLANTNRNDRIGLKEIAGLCKDVLKQDPENPTAFSYLGTASYLLGDKAQTITSWTEALKRQTNAAWRYALYLAIRAAQEDLPAVPGTPASKKAAAPAESPEMNPFALPVAPEAAPAGGAKTPAGDKTAPPSPMAEKLRAIGDRVSKVDKNDKKALEGISWLCREILKQDPENPVAMVYLGGVQYLLGDQRNASSNWLRSLKVKISPALRDEFNRAVSLTGKFMPAAPAPAKPAAAPAGKGKTAPANAPAKIAPTPLPKPVVEKPPVDAKRTEALYEQSLKAYGQGKPADAIKLLNEVLQANPNHTRARKALERIQKEAN